MIIVSLILAILLVSNIYAQTNLCQIKVSSGKKVYLAGGDALGLFERYLQEANKKGVKINLRGLEVVFWDGKTERTVKPGWGTLFSGEGIKTWWKKELQNREAKFDSNRVAKALQYGWDVVCISDQPQVSASKGSETKDYSKKGVCSEETKHSINLGISFINNKQIDNALKEFIHAVSIGPTCPLAWANLISAYVLKENYNLAIDAYKSGLEKAGEDAFLHITGAIAYIKRKEFDYALEALEKGLKLGYKDKAILSGREFQPLFVKRKKDFCSLLDKYGVVLKECL